MTLFSDNEPANLTRYFRHRYFRLRKFEGNLNQILRVYEDETLDGARQRWRRRLENHVRTENETIECSSSLNT